MGTTEKITQQLMDYFACVAYPGRVYGPQEFNSQVMMNVFDPRERAALGTVLEELVSAGVLQRSSLLEFSLTEKGFAEARRLRQGGRGADRGTLLQLEG